MTDLFSLGFSTENNGIENRKIFESALAAGGDIRLDVPGVYPLCDTLFINDGTSLYFGAGVYLLREYDGVCHGSLFVNSGALSSRWNKNIKIEGLRVINNGVFSSADSGSGGKGLTGMRAIVSLALVRDVRISDFETLDLPPANYAIQVCSFENLVIENVHIEGRKDGIHLGRGKNFAIRHGVFRTYDDPIALNAHDYSTANPHLGWIENGVIEDCHDLADDSTVGYFCRILAGSWVEWFSGMEVQQSDTVVSNGKLYRVFMPPDGELYKSFTRPTHERGSQILDGIRWDFIQEGSELNCGCRNIHFKDIFLHKNRRTAFSVHFDKDRYSRSVYPNSPAPVQQNLVFENIFYNAEIPNFLTAASAAVGLKIVNSYLKNTKIRLFDINTEGIEYPETDITLLGSSFEGDFEIECTERRRAAVTVSSNVGLSPESLACVGDVEIIK